MNIESRFWSCLFVFGPFLVVVWIDYAIKWMETTKETVTIVDHLQRVTQITRRDNRPQPFLAWLYTIALVLLSLVIIVYGGKVQ